MCLTKCPSSSTGSYMIILSVRGPLDNSQIGSSQQTGPRLHKVVTFVGSAAAMQHYVVLSAPLLPPLLLSLFLFFLSVSHPYLPTITQNYCFTFLARGQTDVEMILTFTATSTCCGVSCKWELYVCVGEMQSLQR